MSWKWKSGGSCLMIVEERLPRGLYSLKVSWRLNQGGVVGNVRSRDNRQLCK